MYPKQHIIDIAENEGLEYAIIYKIQDEKLRNLELGFEEAHSKLEQYLYEGERKSDELKFNIKLNTNSADTKSAIKSASKEKSLVVETIEQSWERILLQNNTDADLRKLHAVKLAMQDGKIGREPFKLKANGTPKVTKFSKAEALRLYDSVQEIERQAKLKALVDEKPDNYYLLTTEEEVAKLNKKVSYEDIVSFDVETTGVDIFEDELLGISFTLPSIDEHYYVAFEPMDDERALPIGALQLLKPCLEDVSVKKVAHNGLFDVAILQKYGIEVDNLYHDTMTAMHLLNENERDVGGNYQLKYLVPKYLKKEADTFGKLFGKEKDFTKIPLDPFYIYGCKDTHVTYELYEYQRKYLAKMPGVMQYLYDVEMPLLRINLEMEKRGFELDLEFAKEYGETLNKKASEAKATVLSITNASEDVNLNSNQQMIPLLSTAVGKELPNLDAKRTLNPLRKTHEVIDAYLTYKEMTKMSGTYIEGLPQKIHPKTGRLHSRFDSNGARTGRFSSGSDKDGESEGDRTNIQNQPYEARKMFKVPEGRIWISADFKSQEIVIAGALSNEDVIINAFAEGKDNYAMMASKAFNKPYEECYKNPDGSDTKYRKDMKVIYLAKMYGMSVNSLANLLGSDKETAKEFSDSFSEGLPKLTQWMDKTNEFVKKNGFVWIGKEARKRRLPKAKEPLKNIPWGKYWEEEYTEQRLHNAEVNRSMRQSVNAKIQGEAAIMTKVTMLEMDKYLKSIGGHIVAPVHDEIVMEVPCGIKREQVEEIKRIMVESYPFKEIKNGTDLEFYFERWGLGVSEKLVNFEFDGSLNGGCIKNEKE